MKSLLNNVGIFLVILLLLDSDWSWKWDVVSPSKPDTVAVIYESSDTIPEPYVTGALNKLAAEGFQVRSFDKDIVTGTGQTPKELKEAIKAAIGNGLPALVVLSDGRVLKVQNLPKTESEIIEAVK